MKLTKISSILLYLIGMVHNIGIINAMHTGNTLSASASDDGFVLISGEDLGDGAQQQDYPIEGTVLAPFFSGARVDQPVELRGNKTYVQAGVEERDIADMGAGNTDEHSSDVVEMSSLHVACMAAKMTGRRSKIGFGAERAYIVSEGNHLKKRAVGDSESSYGDLKESHTQEAEHKDSLDHEKKMKDAVESDSHNKERDPRCCGVRAQHCCCL